MPNLLILLHYPYHNNTLHYAKYVYITPYHEPQENKMLTYTELQQRAPSVFALEPWQQVSKNYRFVPTIEVVNALENKGFVVMNASQSRTRIEGKGSFAKHMIRFRHADFAEITNRQELLGVPEIVLVNSHDRSSAYKIMLGFFRKVCSNGLIATVENCSYTVRHSGSKELASEIIDASYSIIDSVPVIASKISHWSSFPISRNAQLAYADAALQLRNSTSININPEDVITARRMADQTQADGSRDIWTTYNVVQENLLKGGVIGKSEKTKKQRFTRGIKSISEDVRLNKALWTLTERFAELAA